MKEEKRKEKLLNAEVKLAKYNAGYKELKPHLSNYQKALSEIWKQPIKVAGWGYSCKYDFNAVEILKKYGLVEDSRNRKGWDWKYDIKQLNQRIK
jgi:CRISPR/Cas system CMR-associated protein Cmr1 (group 7 of RAMP superfamily)